MLTLNVSIEFLISSSILSNCSICRMSKELLVVKNLNFAL